MINERDKNKKSSVVKNNEVEHYYIDFTYLIISEKLRSIHSSSKNELIFNDLYYSRLVVLCNDSKFYK